MPNLTADYQQALARIAALQAQDTDAINPLCRTHLLTHGAQVERAVVFLHGFTNCPQQFRTLAQMFFDEGCNVLSARIPFHGLRYRLTDSLAGLTSDVMLRFTGDVLDMAHGLGEEVTLVGLSLGGTLALWAAQQRPDLDRAVSIAPLIAPRHVPRAALPLLVWLARLLPNFLVWWDPKLKADSPGPQHAYPRFATRALAEVFRIAQHIQADARKPNAVPQTRSVLLVTNANDPAVDNAATQAIIARWRANGATDIETYEFDASLQLLHDLIDEAQAGQRTEVVYPVLARLISDAP
ncbi:MAG: alpha/beta fold hydrolase [Chloroflexota bacterium]